MNTPCPVVILAVIAVLLVGCPQDSPEPSPMDVPGPSQADVSEPPQGDISVNEPGANEVDFDNLDQSKVISIAEAAAVREGFKLAEYQPPKVEFDEKEREWWVHFQMRPPTPPGGHFSVLIDVDEKEITVHRGE
jgi:hypothetical protein